MSFVESAYTVTEGGSVTVAISLNADPQRTVAVPITVTNLHGAVAADYSGIPESVTFVGGEPLQQTFSITAVNVAACLFQPSPTSQRVATTEVGGNV